MPHPFKALSGFTLSLALSIALIGCDLVGSDPDSSGPDTLTDDVQSYVTFDDDASDGDVDLVAGQNTDVGEVTIERVGNDLVIQYVIVPGWCATEYHLDVGYKDGDDIVGIPMTPSGNPRIGNFAFKDDDLGCVNLVEVTVPLSHVQGEGWSGGPVIVAAHAVVENVGTGGDSGFLYGILAGTADPGGDIYRISLGDLTDLGDNSAANAFNTVLNPPAEDFAPNSLALDRANDRLYFSNWESGIGLDPLYFIDLTDGLQYPAGDLGLTAFNATATFANGTYYYTPSLMDDDLYAVTFNGNGTIASNTVIIPDFAGAAPDEFDLRYGDYAYRDGLIYGNARFVSGGSLPSAKFFTLNLTTGEFIVLNDDTMLMQLAFNCEDRLIGHSTNTGEFFLVDQSNGDLTDLGDADGLRFNDLAPGGGCEPGGGTETAWGFGTQFPGANWAMYFEFTP